MSASTVLWFRSPVARRLIVLRYIPILAALHLAWETVQLPLYTIWNEGSTAEIAFAVVHCTFGDIVIGTVALALALIATRSGAPAGWPRIKIVLIATAIALGYTVFSEWINTSVRSSWAYSHLMPVVPMTQTGLSPLLQWLILPGLTLVLSLRTLPKNPALSGPAIRRVSIGRN